MKIKSIAARNIKQQNFEHELKPVTIFTGPNWTGKTARLDCITVGINGHHPRLGKRSSDTFKLASGSTLGVGIETEEGKISRTWSKLSGTIKAEITGTPIQIPAVLLDAREYFEKTDRERVNMVFEQVVIDTSSLKASMIIEEIGKIVIGHLDLKKAMSVLEEVSQDIQVSAEAREREEQSLQEWVDQLVEYSKAKLKEANDSLKRNTGAVNTLLEQQAQNRFAGPLNPNAEAELQTIREKKARAMEEAKTLIREIEAATKQEQRKKEIEQTLDESKDAAGLLNLIFRQAAELQPVADRESKMASLSPLVLEINKELAKLNAEINALKNQEKTLNEVYETEIELDSCPCCNRKGKAWQKDRTAKHLAEMKTISAKLGKLITLRDKLKKDDDRIAKESTKAIQQDNESKQAREDLRELNREILRLREEVQLRDKLQGALEEIKIEDYSGKAERHELLAAELNELTQKEDKLLIEQRNLLTKRSQDISLATAKRTVAETETEVSVLKDVVKIIETKKGELVEKTFSALLATANSIAAPILLRPLEYFEGEVGYRIDDHFQTFVTTSTFSGAEEAVAFAAIAIALGALSPMKLVVIDELSRIQPETRFSLIQIMRDLISRGIIDQFIGADWDVKFYARFKEASDMVIHELPKR